jgi:hypothetical protein|eukprot:COSAG06_NODE_1312_length_9891_cov_69.100082_2_plen_69_part_00
MVKAAKTKCEDCTVKHASFGLKDEKRPRWCGVCAKAHAAIMLGSARVCEDCTEKHASFGLKDERKIRW